MKRAKPGDDIYTEDLGPLLKIDDPAQEVPLDCDGCHRLFTAKELMDFCKPSLGKGQQWAKVQ